VIDQQVKLTIKKEMLQSHNYTGKQSGEEVDVIDQRVKPTIKKEMLQSHTCTSKQEGGASTCDRSMSETSSQDGNVRISHLHKANKRGEIHLIDQ
jgi:hypothetical protein